MQIYPLLFAQLKDSSYLYVSKERETNTSEMKTRNKLTSEALRLARQIDSLYNKVELSDYGFFETYHDTMLYQRDGAWEEASEIQYHTDRGEIKFAEAGIKNLQETLAFCKAVIKVQEMTRKLPEPIYG